MRDEGVERNVGHEKNIHSFETGDTRKSRDDHTLQRAGHALSPQLYAVPSFIMKNN